MIESFIKGKTLTEAYHKALIELHTNGEIVDCPDYSQIQKEMSMTIVIEEPTAEPRISRLIIGGPHELMQYEMEISDGILDFIVGAGEHTWSYTYHNRYAHQMPFIISELKRNKYTRRAIMSIRDFDIDSKCDDPACLQSIQYFIRNESLHCKVLFRSNDLPEAFFYNAFALIRLQEVVAAELQIPVGTYCHRANSMHCYEKDFKLLEGFMKGRRTRCEEDLTYNYQDFYKELMEDELGSIMKMVAEQKEKYGIM
jgi:thymidylate synthase